jgi:galactose mutarotase-like enzyme
VSTTAASPSTAVHTAVAVYRGRLPEAVQAENYPFDVELVLQYELSRERVGITATATNHSSSPAPFAFGLHPYFRVSDKEAIAVELPCTSRVHLHEELLVPTGQREPLEDPVLRFDDAGSYDIAFGDVNGPAAYIRNVADGLDVRIDIDPVVEMFVVYSGAHTPFVCVEPWTRGLGGYSSLRENATPPNPALGFIDAGATRTLSFRYSAVHTSQRNGGTRS